MEDAGAQYRTADTRLNRRSHASSTFCSEALTGPCSGSCRAEGYILGLLNVFELNSIRECHITCLAGDAKRDEAEERACRAEEMARREVP